MGHATKGVSLQAMGFSLFHFLFECNMYRESLKDLNLSLASSQVQLIYGGPYTQRRRVCAWASRPSKRRERRRKRGECEAAKVNPCTVAPSREIPYPTQPCRMHRPLAGWILKTWPVCATLIRRNRCPVITSMVGYQRNSKLGADYYRARVGISLRNTVRDAPFFLETVCHVWEWSKSLQAWNIVSLWVAHDIT